MVDTAALEKIDWLLKNMGITEIQGEIMAHFMGIYGNVMEISWEFIGIHGNSMDNNGI